MVFYMVIWLGSGLAIWNLIQTFSDLGEIAPVSFFLSLIWLSLTGLRIRSEIQLHGSLGK